MLSNRPSEVGALSPDGFSCTLLRLSSGPRAVFTMYDPGWLVPSWLPLEPRSWFAVGTQTPLDLILGFGVQEGTSRHTALVALGYIPWFESAVVVHCKVVV